MNPVFLITGFHRSGTTLLADIIRRHPNVQHVFHESTLIHHSKNELLKKKTLLDHDMIQTEGVLYRGRNVQRVFREITFDMRGQCWGNKMSFPGPYLLQEWNGSCETYIQRWLDYFDRKAKIIVMVRHPYDVLASCRRRWEKDASHISNYGLQLPEIVLRDWSFFNLSLLKSFEMDKRLFFINFEGFVSSPASKLEEVFSFLELEHSKPMIESMLQENLIFFGKVDPSRAFQCKNQLVSELPRVLSVMMKTIFERFGYE